MNLKTVFAYHPHDSEDVRLKKFSIFILATSCCIAGTIWAITYYFVIGWARPTFLSALFPIIVGTALAVAQFTKKHRFLIYIQIICIIYIPSLIEWCIGGVFNSGFIMAWSFLGPLCALMFFPIRQSIPWLILFLINIMISAVFNDYFVAHGLSLTNQMRLIFFAMNLGVSSIVIFIFASYYVNSAIQEERKNNELLKENLQQELVLRQNEKLATLGKLSAGVAHELNNPAAATLSSAEQLGDSVNQMEKSANRTGKLTLSTRQKEMLDKQMQMVCHQAKNPVYVDALDSSDLEYEIENWLESRGMENAWEIAQPLVKMGYKLPDLAKIAGDFEDRKLITVLKMFSYSFITHTLIEEIRQGSLKITELVKALKSYSYLDQGPKQSINIHQGLNDTLVMFQSKLKKGVQIEQDYENDLPLIDAFGSELNQVWTNLIDNSVSAMDGKGKIKIKTFRENSYIVVEISDTGPGIPDEIQSKIFDPFFTTKAPGEGTGLGLSISYSIITQKHKGRMKVYSKPGETCFQIKLPLNDKS